MKRDRHTLIVIFRILILLFPSLRSSAQNLPGPKATCRLFYHSSYESDATLNKQYNLIKLKNPRMAPSFSAYMNGMRNIRNGDYATALTNFQTALNLIRSHQSRFLYYYIGVCQLAIGRIRRGYDTLIKLQDVKKSKTQQFILSMELGAASFDLGKYAESAQWYRKTLSMDKNAMKWEIDGYPGAINAVISGVAQMKSLSDADKANFLLNIGHLCLSLGEGKKMAIAVRASLKFNPNNGVAYEILGGLEENNHNFQLAEELCKKALALDFNDPAAMSEDYLEFGNIQLKRHRLQNAISCYRKAVRLDPNNQNAAMCLKLAMDIQNKNTKIESANVGIYQSSMHFIYNSFWAFWIVLMLDGYILLRYKDKKMTMRYLVLTGSLILMQAVIILLMHYVSVGYYSNVHYILIIGFLSMLSAVLFFTYYLYLGIITYKFLRIRKQGSSKIS